jgi:hypothetical protein
MKKELENFMFFDAQLLIDAARNGKSAISTDCYLVAAEDHFKVLIFGIDQIVEQQIEDFGGLLA